MRNLCVPGCILFILACLPLCAQQAPDIPVLNWQERSDWVNVKTDCTPAAVADGVTDDTAALQSALDGVENGSAIYLPPGTYRITDTLSLNGPLIGVLVVGHGRATRIVWDGAEGGRMFRANGAAYSRYIGLSWDGMGKAAVGIDHASDARFETEVSHRHESFRNFTEFGIRVGHEQKIASAEITYLNCLFESCGTAVAMQAFNDYNNTFDGCEFRDCGTGISDDHGNFYARNCHFEASRITDFSIKSEHGDSIRRCTSSGSRQFIVERGTIAPLVVQDCHVSGWQNPDGAVVLNGAPVLMFDCAFTQPPSDKPPVQLARSGQKLMVSGNRPSKDDELIAAGPGAQVVAVPAGELSGVIRDASQRFLHSEAEVPGTLFDAKQDFGAKGDGKTDDTEAIQAAIDAAREHGRGALAYLPRGHYVISQSLRMTGRDYAVGGAGFFTRLVWRGPKDGVAIEIRDPQSLTLEDLAVGHHDLGPVEAEADIRQTSSGGPSRMTYDGVFAYGMYQKKPGKQGILFESLSPESVVRGVHVQGNLRFKDCARATTLMENSYEGTVSIEGKDTRRDGFLGFMMRLATIAGPTVHIRDSHSVVMSDFYNEQSDSHLLLEGNPGDPAGAVTIQGAKMHLNTDEPLLEAHNYTGRVFLSSNQFYIDPKEPRFITTGDAALELILAGHFFYRAIPRFELSPATRLALMANDGVEDTGLERAQALTTFAAALDDLRRLGHVDHQVNSRLHTEQ